MKSSKAKLMLLSLAIAAGVSGEIAAVPIHEILAVTHYDSAVAGIPSSATTEFFFKPEDPSTDMTVVAVHELLHAIGFSNAYQKFSDKITKNDDGTADFSARKEDADGNVIFFVSATFLVQDFVTITHLDPRGSASIKPGTLPIKVFNQSLDIMVPVHANGKSIGELDVAIVDSIFNWTDSGINIMPKFVDWPSSTKPIEDAIKIVTDGFGGPKTDAPIFTWTVVYVPEPATLTLMALGIAGIGRSRRRKTE